MPACAPKHSALTLLDELVNLLVGLVVGKRVGEWHEVLGSGDLVLRVGLDLLLLLLFHLLLLNLDGSNFEVSLEGLCELLLLVLLVLLILLILLNAAALAELLLLLLLVLLLLLQLLVNDVGLLGGHDC